MMRLFLGLVSVIAISAAVFGSSHLACAQSWPSALPSALPSTLSSGSAHFQQPAAVQISWMQSSARPRWGGGQ